MYLTMYKNILLALAVIFVMTGCAESPETEETQETETAETSATGEELQMSDDDKRSYALGANSAGFLVRSYPQFEEWQIAINTDLVKQGFLDTLDEKSKLSQEEMQIVLMTFQKELQQKMAEQQEAEQKQLEQKMADNAAYLEANAAKEGVMVTESGLQYRILREGTGPNPKTGDVVRVHYKGTLLDGSEFDNSYARNKPEEFNVDAVIPGWVEGIKLVKEGGMIELVIGPELGYGEMATPTIPPYSVLTFEVELLQVNPEPEETEEAVDTDEATGDNGS